MTEDYWLRCTSAEPMLEFLHGKASGRKLRLFACCCCYSLRGVLDETGRAVLDTLERHEAGLREQPSERELLLRRHWDYLQALDRYSAGHIAGSAILHIPGAGAWAAAW